MARINFTVRKIDSLKPPADGQIEYWDKTLPGFGIRLSRGGRKSFVVMYRSGGRKRRFTIGACPPMSLADARIQAKAILVAAQKGGDPATEKAATRKAETFAQLAERYVEGYAKQRKKSWRLDEKALQRDGSELIEGLVSWCTEAGDIREALGFVEIDNIASAKVLKRNGFQSSGLPAPEKMLCFRRTF